jgi:hypothetical protein
MNGIVRFSSLGEALRSGYEVCGRCSEGYLVRTRTDHGWAMAIARVKPAEL